MNTWSPGLKGCGRLPTRGTNPVSTGWWVEDPDTGLITFDGTMRFGAGMTRGLGVYRLTLPVPGVNLDPEGFSMIGNATVGYGLTHKGGGLHFCGVDGYVSTDHAVISLDGGLFVEDDSPNAGGTIENIHYWGSYVKL